MYSWPCLPSVSALFWIFFAACCCCNLTPFTRFLSSSNAQFGASEPEAAAANPFGAAEPAAAVNPFGGDSEPEAAAVNPFGAAEPAEAVNPFGASEPAAAANPVIDFPLCNIPARWVSTS